MLKTLDRYIEDSQSESGFLASLSARAGRDRRFMVLFTLSVIFHLIFYAVIVNLDFWAMQEQKSPAGKQAEVVQFTEVAPPPDRYKMRPAPESLERADIDRLQFDPDNTDDTRLLSRSPRPTTQRGSNAPLPSADEIERQAKASRRAGNGGAVNASPNQPKPPVTTSVSSSGIPQPDSPVIAQAPVAQPAPAAPAQKQSAPAPANNSLEPAQAGARRGDGSESNAFALQSSQGQYIAYVRAKIIKENEALLLREYIKDVLNDKVAAVFELRLRRDGQILGLRMVRSSGYPRLDARGREAIYIASPFKGYPESAGDLPPFIVTLNYYPLW